MVNHESESKGRTRAELLPLNCGAAKMTKWLRVLGSLTADQCPVNSTHMAVHKCGGVGSKLLFKRNKGELNLEPF